MGNFTNFLTSFTAKPRKVPDGDNPALRGDGYGNQYAKILVGNKAALAEEGSYFTATGTPGTGVRVNTLVTAFSDTNSWMLVNNTSQPGAQGVWIYPDFLRVMPIGNPTTGSTCMRFAFRIWPAGFNPYVVGTPGGALTPAAANAFPGGVANNAPAAQVIAAINANVFTTLASTGVTVRVVDNVTVPTGVMVTNDCYQLAFGALDALSNKVGLTAARATDTAYISVPVAPMAIGPGETLQIARWSPGGTTASNDEIVLGWWEN